MALRGEGSKRAEESEKREKQWSSEKDFIVSAGAISVFFSLGFFYLFRSLPRRSTLQASTALLLALRHREHMLRMGRRVKGGEKGENEGRKPCGEMQHQRKKRARSSQARRPNAFLRPQSDSLFGACQHRKGALYPHQRTRELEQDVKCVPFAQEQRKRSEGGRGAELKK